MAGTCPAAAGRAGARPACLLTPLLARCMPRLAIWGRASAQARGGGEGVSRPGDTLAGHPKQARGSSGPPQEAPSERDAPNLTRQPHIGLRDFMRKTRTHQRRPSSEGGGPYLKRWPAQDSSIPKLSQRLKSRPAPARGGGEGMPPPLPPAAPLRRPRPNPHPPAGLTGKAALAGRAGGRGRANKAGMG